MVTVILFGIVALYEGLFLHKRNRKPKTYVKVFAVMFVCFSYHFMLEWFKKLPSPNLLVEWVIGPIVRLFS
ncbi:hypothetical protein [Paenibacillus sp. MBLB4367]|uniref:hypothetical protein n=1 Tax=Paenibacillus sp. MBLB4367 TaxID=3384767 RepID=UPI003908161B